VSNVVVGVTTDKKWYSSHYYVI